MGCVVLGSQQQLLCSTNPLGFGLQTRHSYSQWSPERKRCGLALGQIELLFNLVVCFVYISIYYNRGLGT